MRPPGPLDVALLFLLAFIWGSSFTLIKVVVPHLPPLSLTLWRVALAALVLLLVAWWRGETLHFSLRGWFWIMLAGLTGSVLPFSLISWGEEHIDSGLAAILIAITPLMVLLLAHFLTRDERLTPARALGMVLGLSGVVVLIGPRSLLHLGEDALRQLAVAGAALCYALNTLIVRHLQLAHVEQARSGPVALAAAIMIVSALLLAPAAIHAEGLVRPDRTTTALAIMLGVVHTALATLIMFAIIARVGATFFATINFLIPIIGYLLGVFALGEAVSWRALVALALVLGGIWLTARASRSRSRAARAAAHKG